jgi:hypothetical protein
VRAGGRRWELRIDLEVLRSDDGVLTGSVAWEGQGPRRAFHGTLELIALLESATASHGTRAGVTDTPGAPGQD